MCHRRLHINTQHGPKTTELRHKVELRTIYRTTGKIICDMSVSALWLQNYENSRFSTISLPSFYSVSLPSCSHFHLFFISPYLPSFPSFFFSEFSHFTVPPLSLFRPFPFSRLGGILWEKLEFCQYEHPYLQSEISSCLSENCNFLRPSSSL